MPYVLFGQCQGDWVLTQWSPRDPLDPYSANAPFQLAADNAGNVYQVGYAGDSLFLESRNGAVQLLDSGVDTSFQLALSKYTSEGRLDWAMGFPVGPLTSFAPGVATWNDRVAICGTFYAFMQIGADQFFIGERFGAFVLLLDTTGTLLWSRLFLGEGSIWGYGLAFSAGGEVVLTGRFTGEVWMPGELDFSSGGNAEQNYQTFALKLDPEGGVRWAVQSGPLVGSGHDSRGQPIAIDGVGDIVLGGFFSDSLFWGTHELRSGRNSGRTPYLVKLDGQTGEAQWLRGAKASASGYPNGSLYGLVCDHNGNIYGAGYIQSDFSWDNQSLQPAGDYDNLLLCWNKDGGVKWARTFGGAAPEDREWATFALVSAYQTLFVGANVFPGTEMDAFLLPAFGKSDLALLEFTLQGEYVRGWVAGGEDTEFSYGGTIDTEGNLLFCGNSQSDGISFRSEVVALDTFQRTNSFLYKMCLSLPESGGSAGTEAVKLFPNPGKGVFWLEGNWGVEEARVVLYNVLGQETFRQRLQSLGRDGVYPINTGTLLSGVYYLQLFTEGKLIFATPVFIHN
ncbi:MAG: T9SS type A sorting domain-containing protein [Saprospirales bacterium]|nr:T9SS type A sorting domain-containing protein [Saprospirales bacterium]